MQYGYCKMRLTQPVMSSDQAALSLEKFYIYCFKAIGKERQPNKYSSHSLIHLFSKYMSNIRCQVELQVLKNGLIREGPCI